MLYLKINKVVLIAIRNEGQNNIHNSIKECFSRSPITFAGIYVIRILS